MNGKVVLDASAVLALFWGEPGGGTVLRHIPDAVASAVNIAEVAERLAGRSVADADRRRMIDTLGLEIAACDAEQAFVSAALQEKTVPVGLSLGDRICLALAKVRGLPALTADPRWTTVDVGVQVILIRGD